LLEPSSRLLLVANSKSASLYVITLAGGRFVSLLHVAMAQPILSFQCRYADADTRDLRLYCLHPTVRLLILLLCLRELALNSMCQCSSDMRIASSADTCSHRRFRCTIWRWTASCHQRPPSLTSPLPSPSPLLRHSHCPAS
jgi:hypothetical protein